MKNMDSVNTTRMINYINRGISDSLQQYIGLTVEDSKEKMLVSLNDFLENIKKQDGLVSYECGEIKSLHEMKNGFNRFVDYLLWKVKGIRSLIMFFPGLYEKAYLEEDTSKFSLYDIFGEDSDELDILNRIEIEQYINANYKRVKKLKENPYITIGVPITIMPTKPLDYIKLSFQIGDWRNV